MILRGKLTKGCAVDPEVLDALKNHAWPGNVRELKNVVERLCALVETRIRKEHLEQVLGFKFALKASVPGSLQMGLQDASEGSEIFKTLKEFKVDSEKAYLEKVLKAAGGSVTRAAVVLGIDRTYLHQKMAQLEIQKPLL